MIKVITHLLRFIIYLVSFYILFSYTFAPVQSIYSFDNRLYAGYFYEGRYDNLWGVKGRIKTVNFDMGDNGYLAAEWITVIFSYSPKLYWLQVGYYKRRIFWSFFEYTFYVEIMHPDYSHRIYKYNGLTEGIKYDYKIYSLSIYSDPFNPIPPNYWRAVIDPSGYNHIKEFYLSKKYVGVDLQAMVEIDSIDIQVPISHFKNLKLYNGGWKYWDGHVKLIYYPPFHMYEVSNYEFYVWT